MKLNEIRLSDYWKKYVDSEVDLNDTPKMQCPFHGEKHGKSFSYWAEKNKFSCFGACHVHGGDIVDLHMLNRRIKSRREAEDDLYRIYKLERPKEDFSSPTIAEASLTQVELNSQIGKAQLLCKGPDDWIALDRIMSEYPVDLDRIREFISLRSNHEYQNIQ